MFNEKIKTTLTFRLSEELKSDLAQEAQSKGLTISNYIETLVMSRELGVDGEAQTLTTLKERIIQLELENEKLKQTVESQDNATHFDDSAVVELTGKIANVNLENKSLRQQNHELTKHLEQVVHERNTLMKMKGGQTQPHWFSEAGYRQFIQNLQELLKLHSDKTPEQMAILASAVALKNEQSVFFVNTLTDFCKKNPHYLTLRVA